MIFGTLIQQGCFKWIKRFLFEINAVILTCCHLKDHVTLKSGFLKLILYIKIYLV